MALMETYHLMALASLATATLVAYRISTRGLSSAERQLADTFLKWRMAVAFIAVMATPDTSAPGMFAIALVFLKLALVLWAGWCPRKR